MVELKQYIQQVKTIINRTLDELLPSEHTYPETIFKLMRYSIFAGGKRIRPCLLLAVNEACGDKFGNKKAALCASAIEMLHTFSLIHDDLPCMDDDEFRRGKLTAHKAFTPAMAVLGGDAFCIFAFEVLTRLNRNDIIKEISKAIGICGMIGGQVVDIESEGKTVNRETVEYIHNKKTAALIRASVKAGAMLANAPSDQIKRLSSYGNHIGLAFQVVDDILDEESTTETLGKDVGSDRERGKATFPAICGIENSKQYASDLLKKAHMDIEFLGEKGDILYKLAEYIRVRVS